MSYAEATNKLEEMGLQAEAWLHEVRRIVVQMDLILEEIPQEHAIAARALQEAMMELVAEAEDEDETTCEACDTDEPTVEEPTVADPTVAEPTEATEPTGAEKKAEAYFAEVTEAIGWRSEGLPPSAPLAVLRASYNGCAGGLLLTEYELLWIATGSHFSQAKLHLDLKQIVRSSMSLNKSPFGNRAALILEMAGDETALHFACGDALANVEMFSLELATAVAAIPGTVPVAMATTATAAATATATASTTASSAATIATANAAKPAPRQTKQVLAAADLRAKLKQVVELQRSHKAGSNAQAKQILSGLVSGGGKAPSMNTVYKQSEQLRDVALGFGGYAQSKRVIEQFLKMPAVKLLLPDVLRDLQQSSSDVSVAMELMRTSMTAAQINSPTVTNSTRSLFGVRRLHDGRSIASLMPP